MRLLLNGLDHSPTLHTFKNCLVPQPGRLIHIISLNKLTPVLMFFSYDMEIIPGFHIEARIGKSLSHVSPFLPIAILLSVLTRSDSLFESLMNSSDHSRVVQTSRREWEFQANSLERYEIDKFDQKTSRWRSARDPALWGCTRGTVKPVYTVTIFSDRANVSLYTELCPKSIQHPA